MPPDHQSSEIEAESDSLGADFGTSNIQIVQNGVSNNARTTCEQMCEQCVNKRVNNARPKWVQNRAPGICLVTFGPLGPYLAPEN